MLKYALACCLALFALSPAFPAPIPAASSDFSANAPALPNVGANFGGTGVYANYVLIATAPANSAQHDIQIENLSAGQVVIVRDDGSAAPGSAPVNATAYALLPGSAAGAPGGSWNSATFRGRVQIYAPLSTAQVAVSTE